jgi:hypothetical protein
MPIDRGTLDQQLDALGGSSRWWNERELRDLPAILEADEEVIALSRGKVGRLRFARRTRLLVVTDRRLVCMRSGRRSGWHQLEVPVEHIRRVSVRIGPFRGRVVVQTAGDTFRLLLPRGEAYELSRTLSSLIVPTPRGERLGARRVVRRVVDHILAFPAVVLEPEAPKARASTPPAQPALPPAVTDRMEQLEDETEELRRQVTFLEQLLRERQQRAASSALLEESDATSGATS